MKLIMKYIAVLCSCQLDRHISHPWFCQPWVIVHVAEWGIPPPSIAVSEKYFVTSIQFKKSCCSIFRFGFLNNDDCREREFLFLYSWHYDWSILNYSLLIYGRKMLPKWSYVRSLNYIVIVYWFPFSGQIKLCFPQIYSCVKSRKKNFFFFSSFLFLTL